MAPVPGDLTARLSGYGEVLVGSGVLLDVVSSDPVWAAWSTSALAEAAEHATLMINPMVYAEVSITYSKIETLDAVLPAHLYQREPLPWEAGFLAGKCFLRYLYPISISGPTPPSAIWPRQPAIRPAIAHNRAYFPTLELLTPRSRPRP